VYGWSSGVILALDNTSPTAEGKEEGVDAQQLNDKLPEPNRWSDIAYLRWSAICASHAGASVASLQYVFRINVENEDTEAMLDEALAGEDVDGGWSNRATFEPDPPNGGPLTDNNKAFYALLTTPNIRGVCWMLIQHKQQMGIKYISEINVWQNGGDYQLGLKIVAAPPY
jgi:hypothetical protein